MQVTDNAGATDEHRALNYLAMRYPAIYAKAAEQFGQASSLTGVDVRRSPLSSTRNIVDVVFAYTNRNTDFIEKFFVRVRRDRGVSVPGDQDVAVLRPLTVGHGLEEEVNTMALPGFTAEASYYSVGGRYRARSRTPSGPAGAAVTLALDNRTFGTEASVDCKSFPDSITCHECNSFGPGTFNCCELRGMRKPGDSCIIVNDPSALSIPDRPTRWLPRVPVTSRRFAARP